MKQTAVEWLVEQLEKYNHLTENEFLRIIQQAKEMEKEQELKIKIQCLKESLQFIDVNYMAELLNKRIYNMEKELLTFKSE
jgi:predicted HTH domain antitoxin